jgi:alanyl aminopeptidase
LTAASTRRVVRARALAALVGLLLAPHAGADSGVTAVPGLRLPRNVQPLAYDARVRVDPASDDFSASIDITVRVLEPTDLVWLNAKALAVREVRAAALSAPDEAIAGTVVPGSEDVIGLSFAKVLPPGEVRLTLAYTGPVQRNGGIGLFRQDEGGRWYALTQFEPRDARRVFPCFDEPDRKAPWRLTLTVPAAMRAFANMPIESERAADKGWREVTFQRSPPLPSYLVAFAVGEFDVRDAGRAGVNQTPVSIVVPKDRGSEADYAASNAGAVLAAVERYFGQPFPFPKLDLVAYPKSTFGTAMENPGLITFSARALLARPDETSLIFKQRFVSIAAHEISHMWFGDYVTMAWWNDLWLNESFASWLGTRVTQELHPEWPAGWRSLQRTKAIDLDQLAAARALRPPVIEDADIRAAFDSITYAKGETLLAMFEQWLGPDKFREGVRRYVAKYAWGNATAEDFFASLAAADDAALPAFRTFAETGGVPLLDVALDCSGKPSLKLRQQRFLLTGASAPGTGKWAFPACFDFGDATRGRQACALVSEPAQVVPLPVTTCPQWVVANRTGVGYYLPRLTPALYDALAKADRVLAPADYEPLLGDLATLSRSGAVGYDVTLRIAARQAGNPDARSARRACDLAAGVPAAIVDSDNRAHYAAWIRHHFADRARALGWLPRRGDAPDVLRLRIAATELVAVRGGDAALARKAQQLAQRWIVHRSAIPPEARVTILAVAARTSEDEDASSLFESLAEIAANGKDENEREDVLIALGSFRDPALLERAFALATSGKGRFASEVLRHALEDDETRYAALTYVASHEAAVASAVPAERQSFLAAWAGGACTARERVQFVAALEARAAKVDGGERRYKQALERIDGCIAMRRAQQASFNAFIAATK